MLLQTRCKLCAAMQLNRAGPKTKAESTPVEPDPVHTGEGMSCADMQNSHVLSRYSPSPQFTRLFYVPNTFLDLCRTSGLDHWRRPRVGRRAGPRLSP